MQAKPKPPAIDVALAAGFIALHLWAIALAFQLHGATPRGFTIAAATLFLPFLSDALWAWWALARGHPFGYAALAYAALAVAAALVARFRRA